MSVFLDRKRLFDRLALTHSVEREEMAMADPQPKVLNLAFQ